MHITLWALEYLQYDYYFSVKWSYWTTFRTLGDWDILVDYYQHIHKEIWQCIYFRNKKKSQELFHYIYQRELVTSCLLNLWQLKGVAEIFSMIPLILLCCSLYSRTTNISPESMKVIYILLSILKYCSQ